MINAADLRIGNLFWCDQDWVGSKNGVLEWDLHNWFQIKSNPYLLNIILPIHLTAEWLENFGFEAYSGWFYRNDKLVIEACLSKPEWSIRIRTSEESSIYLRNIKHVHQLMNLHFALTNTELTLK